MLSCLKRCKNRIYLSLKSSSDCSKLCASHKRLVLTAPTGSGKSTQVPQMLLDGGLLRRRAGGDPAAAPAADAHAGGAGSRKLAGVKLGGEVGYQIRFDNVTSAATRIRYVTEGVLLRQMLADPELRGISAIIFDEFHERHLYGDITLARALRDSGVGAARSHDHRHVGDAGCRRRGEISPALRGAVVGRAHVSRRRSNISPSPPAKRPSGTWR